MDNLKWIAVPIAIVGLVFVFFGVIWAGVIQLAVAVALLAIAAAIWRTATGSWPHATTDAP